VNLSDIVFAVLNGDDTESAIASRLGVPDCAGAALHQHISALRAMGTLYRTADGRLNVNGPVDPNYPAPGLAADTHALSELAAYAESLDAALEVAIEAHPVQEAGRCR
jgi:hypothetical protein